MQPRKDYDDYTSFINDSFPDEKAYLGKVMTKKLNESELGYIKDQKRFSVDRLQRNSTDTRIKS